MPDRKTVKLSNGDRVTLYKPMRGLSKADRDKHEQLVRAAERRNKKRQWSDHKAPDQGKVPWGFLLLWALMILL